jgi:hypothetical protein
MANGRKTSVAYFSASQGSQQMCLEPKLSPREQRRFTEDSEKARAVREILDEQRELTLGNQIYLGSVLGENWREKVEQMGYDLDNYDIHQLNG